MLSETGSVARCTCIHVTFYKLDDILNLCIQNNVLTQFFSLCKLMSGHSFLKMKMRLTITFLTSWWKANRTDSTTEKCSFGEVEDELSSGAAGMCSYKDTHIHKHTEIHKDSRNSTQAKVIFSVHHCGVQCMLTDFQSLVTNQE